MNRHAGFTLEQLPALVWCCPLLAAVLLTACSSTRMWFYLLCRLYTFYMPRRFLVGGSEGAERKYPRALADALCGELGSPPRRQLPRRLHHEGVDGSFGCAIHLQCVQSRVSRLYRVYPGYNRMCSQDVTDAFGL